MPIAISPEHVDLADSVRSLVARVAPSEVLHEALEHADANPPPIWKAAADQGLQGLHLAESVGGQGFGILELAIVLAEFGYGAVPGPFVPSAIASALISAHDPDSELLHGLADGRHHRRLRHRLRPDRHPPGRCAGDPRRGAGSSGRRAGIGAGVAGRHRFRRRVGGRSTPPTSRSNRSRASTRPTGRPRAGQRRRSQRRPGAVQPEPRRCACARCRRCCRPRPIGVARWATDTASEYAKIREQFGRPIGQFQAVKHKCADMIATTERATAAVWDAARAIDEASQGERC